MNTFFTTLYGVGLGAILGTTLGLFVGEVTVDFFSLPSIDGSSGYAVVFIYGPVGLLLGAILGGLLYYHNLWPTLYFRVGLHILTAILVVWLMVKLNTE